jgi:hypothetical protein
MMSSTLIFLTISIYACTRAQEDVFVAAFAPAPSQQHQRRNLKGFLHRKSTTATHHRVLPSSDMEDTIFQSTATISSSLDGLSKFHRSILSRSVRRQLFVTGKYPLTVTVKDNPTRKWLGSESDTEILVNGTAPHNSLASLDRFNWLDRHERDLLLETYAMVSLELLAVISTERPGYLQILDRGGAGFSAITSYNIAGVPLFQTPTPATALSDDSTPHDRLWVTGFSLAGRQGMVKSVECDTGFMNSINGETGKCMLWPNEVQQVPYNLVTASTPSSVLQHPQLVIAGAEATKHNGLSSSSLAVEENKRILPNSQVEEVIIATSNQTSTTSERYQDAILVCDGFLVPGKDRGGLYIVQNPGNPKLERTVSLTSDVSARPRNNDNNSTNSNDRWFYHRAVWVDLTGDGRQSILTARCKVSYGEEDTGIMSGITKSGELVWLECPAGVSDPLEHTPWKTHVLARGPDVMFSVADLDPTDDTIEVIASEFFSKRVSLHSIKRGKRPKVTFSRSIDDHCGAAFGSILADLDGCNSIKGDALHPRVVDCGSTVKSLRSGDLFSHVLVTSHECSYGDSERNRRANGYSEPALRDLDGGSLFAYRVPTGKDAWRSKPWRRTTVATGFKVKGQLGNMINPGAPGFVYTFHAKKQDRNSTKRPMIAVAGDCAESAYIFRPETIDGKDESASVDPSTRYKLIVEIECGATVGSIGIGYDDFTSAEQESGYAKLYIPCYEKDKVHVFAFGSGEDDDDGW